MPSFNRVLIFDVDGVLVAPRGFADALENLHGISRGATAEFFAGPFQACLIGEANLEDVLPPYLKRWDWRGSTDAFISHWLEADDRPVQGVLDAIEAARRPGDICCVASNQERMRAAYIAGKMGFETRFDRLYFSCALKAAKPQQAFFQKVQDDLGIAPGLIYFWDDSRGNVDAAAAFGWNAYLYESSLSMAHPEIPGLDPRERREA
jgi:putative hydrolase of the HAD superfamily